MLNNIITPELISNARDAWKVTNTGGAVWAFKAYLKEVEKLAQNLEEAINAGAITQEELDDFLNSKMIDSPRSRLTWREHLVRVGFEG